MRHVIRNALIAFSFTACSAAYAATTVPFTFVAGHGAKASEVNANFEALAAAIDVQVEINKVQAAEIAALAARVTKLDTPSAVTAADLVGTYSVIGYRTQLTAGSVAVISDNGTIQLFANGTGTISSSSTISQPGAGWPQSPAPVNYSVSSLSRSFTWSLINGQVSLLGGLFAIASGGRLLVSEADSKVDGVAILVRTN
jgi:hypothetical protein